ILCTLILSYLLSFPTRRSSDLYNTCLQQTSIIDRIFVDLKNAEKLLLEVVQTHRLFRTAGQAEGREKISGTKVGVLHCLTQHDRSEEHTSELQSRFDLVCRLLL